MPKQTEFFTDDVVFQNTYFSLSKHVIEVFYASFGIEYILKQDELFNFLVNSEAHSAWAKI